MGLPLPTRILSWLIAMLLTPFCLIATVAFLKTISESVNFADFVRSTQFWYFASGFALMTGWFFTRACHNAFLYAYVWGHEFTHVMFVILSGGRVAEFEVSSRGGYIVTNKSNFIIGLSPYFVPFWALILGVILAGTSFFVSIPHFDKFFFGILGFTWAFHVFWTLWMIPRDQPDLKENGFLFSVTLIYLLNIISLSAIVSMASPEVDILDFAYSWLNLGSDLYRQIKQVLLP